MASGSNRSMPSGFSAFSSGCMAAARTTGTGIGLAICRRITERHHGSLTKADGTPGRGRHVQHHTSPGTACMIDTATPIVILMADDDPDDRELAQAALRESRLVNQLHFVEDGEQLLAYLRNKPPYDDVAAHPQPGLILLDLNMPKKDGREALAEIKADAQLRHIPVIILTTSRAEEDVFRSYDLGVNSFISKPVTFDGLVQVMRVLGRYWLEIVELPQAKDW